MRNELSKVKVTMIDKIKALLQEVENMTAANAEELEALRIKYLSKKGEISALMNDFRNVPAEQKREVGIYINQLKETAQNKINQLKENFENTQTFNNEIDLTRTAYPINLGTRHPLSLVKKKSATFSAVWDSASPKALKWKMTGMYSHR